MPVTIITDESADSGASPDNVDDAEQAADAAENSADTAEDAADAAEDSAESAEESADSAEESAEDAMESAESAQDSVVASMAIFNKMQQTLEELPAKIAVAVRGGIAGTHTGQTVTEVEDSGGLLEPVMESEPVVEDSTPGSGHPYFRKWGKR